MPILLAVIGFLSGSVLYSALLPRLFKGVDVRQLSADKNPGAANAFKYGGAALGFLSLFCDLLKAYLPVRLALSVTGVSHPAFSLLLAAPVLGHAFSPFARFHGGKAIAASFGVLLALLPEHRVGIHLAFWYIVFSTLILIRPHAVRTVLAFVLTAAYAATQPVPSVCYGTLLICAVVTYRHYPSLRSSPFGLHLLGIPVWPRGTLKRSSTAQKE